MEHIFFSSGILVYRGVSYQVNKLELIDEASVHISLTNETHTPVVCFRVDETVINWDTITSIEQFPVYLGVPFLEPE